MPNNIEHKIAHGALRLSIMVLSLLLSTSGCKKLVSVGSPVADVESKVVYSNDVTATSAVLGIYSQLLQTDGFISGTPFSILSLTGLSSDELVNYPRSPQLVEFEENDISPSNSYVFSVWNSVYKSIYVVNAVIEGVGNSDGLSSAIHDQLMGEALFMRAFCYFHLVNLFGDVPLVLTTDYRTNANIPRSSSELVYDQILLDLQGARTLLGTEYAASYKERIRPNKFTASALLSRVYLYRKNWANAESMATEVIANEQIYSLNSSVADIFLANSTETIWQLKPNLNGDFGYTNEAISFSPQNNSVLKNNVLRHGIVELFESGDQRLARWIEYIAVGSNRIYFPRKYKQNNRSAPLTEYSSVFRLAEQYLIRAEARAMQNNLLGANSAESDVNRIRLRAGISPASATTQTEMLDEILRQRRLEFLAEGGHRWFDLKRLGKATEVLTAAKGEFENTDSLFPVPASEFRNNPTLGSQNPGY